MEHQQKSEKGHQFITFSFVFALLSILTIQFIILPLIFGGLSILFAILGRGHSEEISPKGKVSIVISSFAIVLTIFVTTLAITMIFTNPTMRQQLNETSLQIYGETFDDTFEKSFGYKLPPAKAQELPDNE